MSKFITRALYRHFLLGQMKMWRDDGNRMYQFKGNGFLHSKINFDTAWFRDNPTGDAIFLDKYGVWK